MAPPAVTVSEARGATADELLELLPTSLPRWLNGRERRQLRRKAS